MNFEDLKIHLKQQPDCINLPYALYSLFKKKQCSEKLFIAICDLHDDRKIAEVSGRL